MLRRLYLLLTITLSGFLILGTTLQPARINASKLAPTHAGAKALSNVGATRSISLADDKEKCATCHEDEVASFDNGTHSKTMDTKSLACANCHGDATKHLAEGGSKGTMQSFSKLSPSEASEACLNCHEKTGTQSHMRQSEHMLSGVSCITCHDVHPDSKAKAERTSHGLSAMMREPQEKLCATCHTAINAQFSMPTHHRLKEGVLECSNCHNPHGSTEQKQLLAENSTKENCVKCHEDKRGPFAYEHDAGNLNGCIGCHQPHGSSAPHMLKAKDERTLCVSCHSKEAGTRVPHGRGGLQASGDCSRCHSEIHGSHNSPFFLN